MGAPQTLAERFASAKSAADAASRHSLIPSAGRQAIADVVELAGALVAEAEALRAELQALRAAVDKLAKAKR